MAPDRSCWTIAEIAGEAPEPEVEIDLFSLISAFRAVVERTKARPKMYLPSEQIPIEDRIEQLMTRLSETEACGFEDLFQDIQTRAGLVVTFLAVLEMIRLKLVRVFQSGVVGPIRIYKRARPADAPKPLGDPEQKHADIVRLAEFGVGGVRIVAPSTEENAAYLHAKRAKLGHLIAS